MLAVMCNRQFKYEIASISEAESELIQCRELNGQFQVVWLQEGRRQAYEILKIEARKALIKARKHRKWVELVPKRRLAS